MLSLTKDMDAVCGVLVGVAVGEDEVGRMGYGGGRERKRGKGRTSDASRLSKMPCNPKATPICPPLSSPLRLCPRCPVCLGVCTMRYVPKFPRHFLWERVGRWVC